MQIHEMFQRKTLTEVDLVGPSSIFNVGREAFKDKKAWVSSKALGAAQQRAIDQYARAHAPAVAQAAQANIAPLAKQLAQGWRQIGAQLPSPIASPTTVPGAAAATASQKFGQQAAGYKNTTTNIPSAIPGQYKSPITPTSSNVKTKTPPSLKPNAPIPPEVNPDGSITVGGTTGKAQGKVYPTDPNYKSLLAAIKKTEPTAVNEDAAADYRTAFIQYARKVLGARGIDTKAIGFDPTTNQELNRILSQITASHNDPDKQQQAVEKYFLTALNKWHEIQSNPAKYNQAFSGGRTDSSDGSGKAVAPGETNKDLDSVLRNIGITPLQLAKLGKAAVDASKGNREIRSTGNPIWDSVLKAAGMRV